MLPEPPQVDWEALEAQIKANGLTIDRPRHTVHPHHPEVVYPIDYGYLNGTVGEDGDPIDVFVGSAPTGLVAATRTIDRRKGDSEIKLLYDCDPSEIYLVHGFLNYAPELMTARLVTRAPASELWKDAALGGDYHHLDLYVTDLAVSAPFYAAFLGRLGYRPYQAWPQGQSFIKGRAYVTLVQTEAPHVAAGFHRKRPGVNHLAFELPTRVHVDAFVRDFLAPRGIALLYGGIQDDPGAYAAFFEDPDRLKLEVVAPR